MHKARLEAFSDAVIAIIMTIMVLELRAPHETNNLAALQPLIPVFLSYLLSFIYLGVYWVNHHHLLQAAKHINGTILWLNLHLLFWLTLIPFTTAWMGKNPFAPWPVAVYGIVMLFAGASYVMLSSALVTHHGRDSLLAKALGQDIKGKASVVLYTLAIPLAFVNTLYACTIYVLVALIWFIPDQRIEKALCS